MSKTCPVCAADNKDDAQFCRVCGTSLADTAAAAPTEAAVEAGIACDECGFQNKPGVRYCANCGVSLLGTVIVPRSKAPAADGDDPFAGLSASPPPLSYPSFAPVAPYPPAPAASETPWGFPPAGETTGGLGHDDPLAYPPSAEASLPPPDVPDADLAALPQEREAFEAPIPSAATPAAAGATPSRAPLIIGALVAVLVIAGGAGWWFMGRSSEPVLPAASALPPPSALPASAVVPAPIQVVAVPAPASAAASLPLATVAPGEVIVAPGTAASGPEAVPETDAEAKRLAAEKARKDKSARDKADRDTRAKALADQREQAAAAAARAEQEALARRRAEEAQRRAQPAAPATQPPAAQARGVRELCAGRSSIAESICQSRECGAPEHINEAVCRQIREADERRRNYTN